MSDKPDVEKWMEVTEREYDKVGGIWPSQIGLRAATAAFLRAAAADGFRLVRVPDEASDWRTHDMWRAGFNEAIAATLASAVEVGE
jgi:hypothetical protein